jgi:preprotein translocase subunit SecB
MAKIKTAPISEEDYLTVLQGLEIIQIDVDDFSGKVLNRARLLSRETKRTVSVSEKSEFRCGEDTEVIVKHSYVVTVMAEAEEKNEKLLILSLRYRLLYDSKESFTEEFFEQFSQISLRLQTAPFARAWIHDHCLRMGVPPLIMPLIRTQ